MANVSQVEDDLSEVYNINFVNKSEQKSARNNHHILRPFFTFLIPYN